MASNGTSTWTQQALLEHLQDAVELELFTIPLYLTAMYSITPAAQAETGNNAYNLIQSVVNEEMLHLELACNTLNAIGGHPSLTGSSAPSYPENIPFIQPPVVANLGPATPNQILLFLNIELPTWDDPNHDTDTNPEPAYDTIGEFYAAIETGLTQVGQFPGGPQASNNFPPDDSGLPANPPTPASPAGPVTDLTTADMALNLIVSQGEGTTVTNPDDEDGNLAHYYRFQQIAANLKWITGTTSDGSPRVYNMLVNPDNYVYSARQGGLLTFFDGCYSFLLQSLESAFNGANPVDVSAPIGAMFGVIDPLMKYVISQTYDQAGLGYGKNLTPRFNYIKVTVNAPGTTSLQGLYNKLDSADQASLKAVAQALGLTV